MVFASINLALFRIRCLPGREFAGFTVPAWVPVGGFLSSAALLGYVIFAAFGR